MTVSPSAAPVSRGSPAAVAPGSPLRRLVSVLTVRDDTAGPDSAVDRLLRRFGLTVGVVGVLAAVLELPEILVQHRQVPVPLTLLIFLAAFGMMPVLAVASVIAEPPMIRAVAGAAALGYLTTLVLIQICFHAVAQAPGSIWAYRLVTLGVLAAALAWPPAPVLIYLCVASALPGLTVFVMLDGTSIWAAFEPFVRHVGLSLLLLWCVAYSRSAAVRVDRESAAASRRAATAAAVVARDRERDRFAALIHDAVLSTLLDAAREGGGSPVLRRQAESTLEQLDAIEVAEADADCLDADATIDFLRSAVHEINAGIEFSARRADGRGGLCLPVTAASTVAAALTEAVRNSLRHASVPGRAVRRSVVVTVGSGGLWVQARDDGAGFDIDAVSADRLGIAVSILGRMRQLPGGAGFVSSEPGQGTVVTLVWGSTGGRCA